VTDVAKPRNTMVLAALRERPWEELPPKLAGILAPHVPGLAEEIITAIAASIPEYGHLARGASDNILAVGVQGALTQFVRMIEDREARSEWPGLSRSYGRTEMRQGRSLDALQAAYRVGARVAWRRVATIGAEAGLEAQTLHLLAEAIFAYIDELASASVEGYTEAQSAIAGEAQRRRQRLLVLLLTQPQDFPAVVEACRVAGWQLPQSVAAVALGGDEDIGPISLRLDAEILHGYDQGSGCLIVPDPDGPARSAHLERALTGHTAALGPTVGVRTMQRSLSWARKTLSLAERGALPHNGLLRVTDHLLALALADSRTVTAELERRLLEPLASLPAGVQTRLRETLLMWLQAGGSAPGAARLLHVHPQTVRYRISQLRSLLGATLDDAQVRFELELVLRSSALGMSLAPEAGEQPVF
jgi:hypothetical protein